MTETTFIVQDMTCGHCEETVRNALNEALPGAEVRIDLPSHKVVVNGDADRAIAAIKEVGYTPERAE
ncbi:heavy-metal-associated domain-containing protein [Agrobacterium larrymoorei]|uniref:heavy-metal-associated domain-containing protein n=1 Tax=Agrobacterium larrymoorei TaxID=160699 RepID=UPI0030BAF1F4